MIDTADGLPAPQRYWAILTIALGLIMAVMDGAIANVALPTIAQDPAGLLGGIGLLLFAGGLARFLHHVMVCA
jgi:hypothetical protein